MKTLLSISLFVLSTSLGCTAYQSEAHEFLQNNGRTENSKIVISSTDSFKKSFCMTNSPDYKEFSVIKTHIHGGKQESLQTQFDVYKNPKETKAKVHFTGPSFTYTCLFNLKQPDFSAGNIEFIIDEGLLSLQGALE